MRDVAHHEQGPAWVKARLKRHLGELVRLAAPAMATRLGIMAMGFVDTVMVGRYATAELAWLSLANRSVIMLLLVVSIGLLMGVIVSTASAFGKGEEAQCGRVFRRTLPYAMGIGLLMMAVALPAPLYMPLLAEDPTVARESARLVVIMGLGLPAHLLFFCASGFLEGVQRPHIATIVTLLANGLNVALNWMLIYGHWGAPELGAAGSAWCTTAVRWALAGMLLGYVFSSPAIRRFGVRRPHGERWRDWAHQRTLGFASAVSIGAEVGAFAGLAVIAERLGQLELAAQEVAFNVLTVPFMFAIGAGSATAVRVGVAHGRGDPDDTALAGWSGLGLALVLLAVSAVAIALYPAPIFFLHSDDPRLAAIAIPAIAFVAYVVIFDGGQATISMALRGLGETWWPTAIQAVAYMGLMLPLAYAFSLAGPRGVVGLFEATLIASVFSLAAQALRFWWLTSRRAAF